MYEFLIQIGEDSDQVEKKYFLIRIPFGGGNIRRRSQYEGVGHKVD
jgi:hypothetical protein